MHNNWERQEQKNEAGTERDDEMDGMRQEIFTVAIWI